MFCGDDLVDVFKELCCKHKKYFMPDGERQSAISKSLVDHYALQDLLDGVEDYICKSNETVTVYDFALKSGSYIDKAKKERASIQNFRDIVSKTRKIIENNEL